MSDDTVPSSQAPESDPKQVQRAKKPRAKPPVKSALVRSSIHEDEEALTGTTEEGIGQGEGVEVATHSNGNTVGCDEGDVTLVDAGVAADDGKTLESLPIARARDGETRKQCWERLRQEARTAGMTRRDAISYAGCEVELLFPPKLPEPEPVIVEPEPVIELEPEPITEPAAPTIVDIPPQPPAEQGVPGLGDIPGEWGTLAANASLQVEISWVSANRLRVRDGNGVNLSRALSPAPSYSALSWLETSILFPAKFADISVKATANQEDEAEAIRREKLSIEEVRSILAEMLKG